MTTRRVRALLAGLAVAAAAATAGSLAAARAELPARLSDEAFWQLSESLSEPGGRFQSDNLVSNETGMQRVIPELTQRLGAGVVYLGVGPEQNYTYIAALKPRIAFIVDIRRGNRDLHLMYKALFELSADRADFIAQLFSRPRPDGLTRDSTAGDLFTAFAAVAPSETMFGETRAQIRDTLRTTHGLPLSVEELAGIEFVLANFFRFGPAIGYSSTSTGRVGGTASYASLMQATDLDGIQRSYLSSDAAFRVVKSLHAANLLVPVIGNFSGPKAVRAVGDWVRERGATVSVFYLSNVEDYLSRDNTWPDFCRNVATLPLTATSTFIRTGRHAAPLGYVTFFNAPPPSGGVAARPPAPPATQRPQAALGISGSMDTSRLALISENIKACAPGW